jgi:hypothetical protein
VFCSKCRAENVLQQRFCRQCGMLMLSDTDFSLDQRVVQELTRLREGDCQLEKLVLTLESVGNSLTLSFVFLILLSVVLAARGQVHIDLFLSVGAQMVTGWQFRRFLSLFREFMGARRASAELMRSAASNSGELPDGSSLSGNLRRRQTSPLSVSQRTTLRPTFRQSIQNRQNFPRAASFLTCRNQDVDLEPGLLRKVRHKVSSRSVWMRKQKTF